MVNQRVHSSLLATGVLVTVLTVSACGGDDKPAVCSDVDSLKSSISGLTDIKLEQGAVASLETQLTQVQDDYTQLKDDAKSQFGTELSAVDSAASALKSGLETASADASAANIAALAPLVQALTSSLSALQSAVEDTC